MFVLQLFIDVGFKELLFTSDGQDTLDSAFRLRPHEDVLLTVNFMRDRNGLEQLEEFQVGVVCGCGVWVWRYSVVTLSDKQENFPFLIQEKNFIQCVHVSATTTRHSCVSNGSSFSL